MRQPLRASNLIFATTFVAITLTGLIGTGLDIPANAATVTQKSAAPVSKAPSGSNPLSGLDIQIADKPVIADLYPARVTHFKGGAIGLADVVYSSLPGFRPLTLDLYLPPKAKAALKTPYPVIIYVHGGGWVAGHSRHNAAIDHFPDFLASLARRGYVVASLTYRLDGEAPFPAQENDVRAAIRWLRSHATDYSLDTTRFGIWGGSAGGHLIGLTAVGCGVSFDPPATEKPSMAIGPQESDCVQAAVGWYGVYNFLSLDAQRTTNLPAGAPHDPKANAAVTKLLNCDPAACQEAMAKASPISYVDKSDPPMLLIAGAEDQTVPYQQSIEMHDRLLAAGVPSQVIILPGVDHSFIGKTPEATRTATLKALEATIAFFDKQLK